MSACTILHPRAPFGLFEEGQYEFTKGLMGDELDHDGYFDRGCLIHVCMVAEGSGRAIDTHLMLFKQGIEHDRVL